ncbi:MAG: Xaa-Pro peptidase family protein, partial [Candidatus Aenigmarchaeota archaeon]|nr:Xaa-Pro peptidase family protein [Candidatus Aenigmarchaeota archaeon]
KTSHFTAYLILKKGKPVVITNPLEYRLLLGRKSFTTLQAGKNEYLKGILKKNMGKKIGLNYSHVSVASFKKIKSLLKGRKFIDVSEYMSDIRSVKTKEEIKNIKEACRITEEMFSYLQTILKKGITEKEIADEIEIKTKRLGADGMAFPPIIASGKNSAIPHHRPGGTGLTEGILLADIGVIYNGYCSDMTRTFFVGEPGAMHNHMYSVVNKARKDAIGIARAGTKSKDVFDAANSIIKKNYNCDMIHSLGHGLGIEVHDYPQGLSSNSGFVLKKDMCLAIEPAYYKEGFGGMRIEDDVVVGNGKAKLLSKAPDRLVVL